MASAASVRLVVVLMITSMVSAAHRSRRNAPASPCRKDGVGHVSRLQAAEPVVHSQDLSRDDRGRFDRRERAQTHVLYGARATAASQVRVEPSDFSPVSRATPSATSTSRLPIRYRPSPAPAAAIASETRATRPGASRQSIRITSGRTWTPSLITSSQPSGFSTNASTGPGAR